jgi:hypothetical protein
MVSASVNLVMDEQVPKIGDELRYSSIDYDKKVFDVRARKPFGELELSDDIQNSFCEHQDEDFFERAFFGKLQQRNTVLQQNQQQDCCATDSDFYERNVVHLNSEPLRKSSQKRDSNIIRKKNGSGGRINAKYMQKNFFRIEM